MTKFFGTDGIRQKATAFTPDFLHAIARGLVECGGDEIKVLIGGDTRESTEWILSELETALESLGVEVASVGVLPTPAINYVFFQADFDFAIDVTASHNPYTDNGIKIFERGTNYGQKLSAKGQEIIEQAILDQKPIPTVSKTLKEELQDEAREIYEQHLLDYVGPADFSGLNIGIDCANGATSVIGGKLFTQLGAKKVKTIHCDANYGRNINKNCGSTSLESLQELVKKEHLDFGVAFDGDGDRVLMVDQNGEIIDGDQILVILAEFLQLDSLVVTVMANQGIFEWAKKHHQSLEVTAVGDQNVSVAMQEKNLQLGGEQSGHIILPGEPTGDGMLVALMITKIIAETNTPLHQLAASMTKFPQIILNFPATATEKQNLKTSPAAQQLLLDYHKKLEKTSGRLLVRSSGTEELIRVTLWGKNESKITQIGQELIKKLKEIL